MNIAETRETLKRKGAYNVSHKRIVADWLAHSCIINFNLGLTLMPKKVPHKHVPGKSKITMRHLNKHELERAGLRFVEILNKVVYRNAYLRHGRQLDVVMVMEGEKSYKDLHLHFALRKPDNMIWMEFARRTKLALKLSSEFMVRNDSYDNRYGEQYDGLIQEFRYKLDVVDSGWLYYITKELGHRDTSNLYLP